MVEHGVAVVTGGRRGIGAAITTRFLDEGWYCAVLDSHVGPATDADPRPDAEDHSMLVRCDVRDSGEVSAAISQVVAAYGRIDALINNAGIVRPAPSHEVTSDDLDALLDVHLAGALHMCKASLPALLKSSNASVVNVSSVCASRGFPGRLAYNAAKAGIEALTRTLAVEWGPHQVRVNSVAPGFILTENSRRLYDSGVVDLAARQALVPLGRLGKPHEVASAVHWLSTPEASYVNGHVLLIDGGYVVNGRTGPDLTDRDRTSILQELSAVSTVDGATEKS